MKATQQTDSFDVVHELVFRNQRISYYFVLDVPKPPLLQERVSSTNVDESTLQTALELKKSYGLSFWDGFLLMVGRNLQSAANVFSAALLHDKATSRLRKFAVKESSIDDLRRCGDMLGPGQMLALSSKVELGNGEVRHIPMLDFHCRASDDNRAVVISAIRALTKQRGVLLESGKSYHYYGTELMNQEELIRFLARSLLLGPIVDRRWIAHQLIEGACALRIGKGHGYSKVPFVVAELP